MQPNAKNPPMRKWVNDKYGRKKENSTDWGLCAAYSLRSTENDEHIFTCISKRTTHQSLPAAPCPATGEHLRPIKWPKTSEVDLSGFSNGEVVEMSWISLQQWIVPEWQFWSEPDMAGTAGTATTAVMKVTIERNLECIVERDSKMSEIVRRLRSFHPRDKA